MSVPRSLDFQLTSQVLVGEPEDPSGGVGIYMKSSNWKDEIYQVSTVYMMLIKLKTYKVPISKADVETDALSF